MVLSIAFSGVASASSLAEYTPEKQTVNTLIGYDRMEIGDQGIDAGGSNEGSMAKGTISAGVSVFVVDGSDGGVGSILSYEEKSTASGSFQFHKEMSYTSKVTTP